VLKDYVWGPTLVLWGVLLFKTCEVFYFFISEVTLCSEELGAMPEASHPCAGVSRKRSHALPWSATVGPVLEA
jgi:hypothetical protein